MVAAARAERLLAYLRVTKNEMVAARLTDSRLANRL